MQPQNNRVIVWVKAQDPYQTVDERELGPDEYEYTEDIYPPEDDDGGFDLEGEREETDEKVKSKSAIFTPLGVIILDENTDMYKLFNFWIGHTNFGLTEDIQKVIEDVPGVEVLHTFTRYRMRVAFAKCFKANKVCHAIKAAIDKYLDTKDQ